MADTLADREIVVTRVIDAPRDVVFAAWTEREHVEQWWLPSGGTTHEWNPQPGGQWRYSTPGPEGAHYSFKVKFIEIAKPTRLVYDHGTDAENAPEPVRTNVTFDDQNGKTKVTLQLVFATAAALEEAARYGARGGAKAALETLAGYLARL
ncbi:MAG TPA: SRPBCC domain-containing protein [Anaerolineales bacterium]|nr:SRPBCC domain-containing protein [Anaerolineales bacterium]